MLLSFKKFNESLNNSKVEELKDVFLDLEDQGYLFEIEQDKVLKCDFPIDFCGEYFICFTKNIKPNTDKFPGDWEDAYVVTLRYKNPCYSNNYKEYEKVSNDPEKIKEAKNIIKKVKDSYISIERYTPKGLTLLGAKDATREYAISEYITIKFAFIINK